MKTTATSIDDLTKIIRKLMFFIIDEGKNCISKDQEDTYVTKYLFLFAKIMNQIEEPDELKIDQLIDLITKDIEKSTHY